MTQAYYFVWQCSFLPQLQQPYTQEVREQTIQQTQGIKGWVDKEYDSRYVAEARQE